MPLDIVCVIAGAVLVASALNDVFQAVIVPRSVGHRFRVSYLLWRGVWWLWPSIAWRIHPNNEDAREDFLAVFAPFTLVVLIATWLTLMIFGFGLIFFALRAGLTPKVETLGETTYFSGVSLTTIGFGDIAGRTPVTRILSVVAAMSGLALFSITTTYLFALFGNFQSRETFVVEIGARAGAPPSGVELLAIAGYSQTRDDLPRVMTEGQHWIAMVMGSHLAYPMLAYFRSSHDYESWVGTLGTLLDAATLMITTIRNVPAGQAHFLYNVGRHAARDLARYFHTREIEETVGIERAEFESACDHLEKAGYELHARDEAWEKFALLRSSYASHLSGMAHFFAIPPIAWIGDRTLIRKH